MTVELDWVLFDLDGTLADSKRVLFNVYTRFLNKRNRPATEEEFAKLDGPSIPEVVTYLKHAHQLPEDLVELVREYQKMVQRRLDEGVPLMEYATETIERLDDAGIWLGLVTSAEREVADAFLRRHGLEGVFALVVTGDETDHAKPDPAIYRLAVARCSAPANRIAAVEDSAIGVAAAKGAGVFVVRVGEKGSDADAHAQDLREAGDILFERTAP